MRGGHGRGPGDVAANLAVVEVLVREGQAADSALVVFQLIRNRRRLLGEGRLRVRHRVRVGGHADVFGGGDRVGPHRGLTDDGLAGARSAGREVAHVVGEQGDARRWGPRERAAHLVGVQVQVRERHRGDGRRPVADLGGVRRRLLRQAGLAVDADVRVRRHADVRRHRERVRAHGDLGGHYTYYTSIYIYIYIYIHIISLLNNKPP